MPHRSWTCRRARPISFCDLMTEYRWAGVPKALAGAYVRHGGSENIEEALRGIIGVAAVLARLAELPTEDATIVEFLAVHLTEYYSRAHDA
jgi:hypothetical protein